MRTKANSESRLRYINACIGKLDLEVNTALDKLCISIQEDNAVLHKSELKLFSHKREYYPMKLASLYNKNALRKTVVQLDDSLVTEFEELHNVLVTDYSNFKRKLKFMLSELFMIAQTPADFELIIPQSLFNMGDDVAFMPTANPRGWEEGEAAEFLKQYDPLIKRVKYYLNIRRLL